MPTASIIIPSLGRPESLDECLHSISLQTFRDFETVLVTEEGPLAKLRNGGARRAKGDYLIFVDDDISAHTGWLDAIVRTFSRDTRIGGVSGPAWITREYRGNRDIFRIRWAKYIYDQFFCNGRGDLPGHIMSSGAWTTGASRVDCKYDGEVHFLEACNMAFRADVFYELGGFDEQYLGVGDWSEPDLAFRVREAGHKLWFSRDAVLEHRPSKSGAYKKRGKDAPNRLANYGRFSRRWIKPCFKHTLYKWFLKSYYGYSSLRARYVGKA